MYMVTPVRIGVLTHIAAPFYTHACNQSFLTSTLMYHLIFLRPFPTTTFSSIHTYRSSLLYNYTILPPSPTTISSYLPHLPRHLPPTLTMPSFYHTNTYSHTFLLLKPTTTSSYHPYIPAPFYHANLAPLFPTTHTTTSTTPSYHLTQLTYTLPTTHLPIPHTYHHTFLLPTPIITPPNHHAFPPPTLVLQIPTTHTTTTVF
jgi:hypothetical protein